VREVIGKYTETVRTTRTKTSPPGFLQE